MLYIQIFILIWLIIIAYIIIQMLRAKRAQKKIEREWMKNETNAGINSYIPEIRKQAESNVYSQIESSVCNQVS